MGKDLHLVKLDKGISGKEKYDPDGATEEFFDAVWQQISRG